MQHQEFDLLFNKLLKNKQINVIFKDEHVSHVMNDSLVVKP